MDELYEHLLGDMEAALRKLTKQVSPPRWVPFGGTKSVLRYVERTAQQAIIQKLGRIISGLRAAHLLLRHELVQEAVVIHRVLGELLEDVLFLSYGILRNELTDTLHKSYLMAFFQEDLDTPGSGLDETQRAAALSRKKIQAYLARDDLRNGNAINDPELFRAIDQAFARLAHPADQAMDLAREKRPQIQGRGMSASSKAPACERDIWNYFERGIAHFVIVAGVFGDRELQERLLSQKKNFDAKSQQVRK